MESKELSLRSTSLAAPTSKSADLLQCKTITRQVKEHGSEAVRIEIGQYLEKAAIAIGVEMSNAQLSVISSDLLDMYKHDALEDLRECLKKGRRGHYGFGMNQRKSLSVPLIQEWMQQHLSDKALVREQKHFEEKRERKAQSSKGVSPKVQKMLADFHTNVEKRKEDAAEERAEQREEQRQEAEDEKKKQVERLAARWGADNVRAAIKQVKSPAVKEGLENVLKGRER